MKDILRRMLVCSLSLFIVSQIFSGLVITGGFISYVYAGIFLAVLTLILDPIVKIITLPFQLLTLGLLSFLTITVSLFILTLFYANIAVTSFTFTGVQFLGLTTSSIHISGILSYLVISGTIYFLNRLIDWVFTE